MAKPQTRIPAPINQAEQIGSGMLLCSHAARRIVVVKNIKMRGKDRPTRLYYSVEGTWTQDLSQAHSFHNFRTAVIVQTALRGDDSCLIR